MPLPIATSLQTARIPGNFASNRSVNRPRVSGKWRVGASWQKVCTRQELDEGEGRFRGNVDSQKIFVQEYEDQLYCLSNVCTHLSLPLVGRTALLQGQVKEGCIECPAHKTLFDLATGEVKGDWAPGFPEIPFIGKGDPKPLATFEVKEEEGEILVNI